MKKSFVIKIPIVLIIATTILTACPSSDSNGGPTNANRESTTTATLSINVVRNWFVGEIWNPLVDFSSYIYRGTNCTGQEFDADFAYELYLKSLDKMDMYTEYIHANHQDIISAWDKMMEQVKLHNSNLADGYEIGSEGISLSLLEQYSKAFYDYCSKQAY